MITPHASFMDSIARWEGGWQDYRTDSGNWVNCSEGRKLVGTMRGVTPAVAARHLGMDKCDITPEIMKDSITLEVAAEIGMRRYYDAPGFDDLEWSPLAWIAVDIGWGSGPIRGIKMLQEQIGAIADGIIGPQTQAVYADYISTWPMEVACKNLSIRRREFYLSISEPGTKNHMFRNGWLRRADYYSPAGNGADTSDPWWPKWAGWQPSGASDTGQPVAADVSASDDAESPDDPLERALHHSAEVGRALIELRRRMEK